MILNNAKALEAMMPDATQAQSMAQAEGLRAEQAQSLAQSERLRVEKLAAKLRSLGIEPETD